MKTKNIKQRVFINTSPARVYHALMSALEHTAFTGGKAVVKDKVGSAFSFYDGYITGANTELVKNKKIVQQWRAIEEGWPEDYYSTVNYELLEENGGTRILFTHSGVPAHVAANIDKGWEEYYWEPLRLYLERKKR